MRSRDIELLAALARALRDRVAPLQIAIDQARLVDHDPVQRTESTAAAAQHAEVLAAFADEVLDLARIEQGRLALDRQSIELAHLLDAALELTRGACQPRHAVHVEMPDAGVRVVGDGRRLVQVFESLLHNAVARTPLGGRIVVTVAVDHAAGRVAMTFCDDGDALAGDARERAFASLFAPGGRGTGMYAVKRLVELHGGAVCAATDAAARGAYTVELPCDGVARGSARNLQ
nr:HAMP domain-containing sensor histidine kinase [Kofleriaceae bacterium]